MSASQRQRRGRESDSRREATIPETSAIARQFFDAGLEGEELFAAIWAHHDLTGLEPRDIFHEYKLLHSGPAF